MKRSLVVSCTWAAWAAWAALAVPAARAQDAAAPPAATVSASPLTIREFIESLTDDMPVTTAPATFVLGVAGTEVPRVSTFREFAAQLASAVGEDGRVRESVAVEINPRLALGPVRWSDYQESRLTQILTRTTISAATLPESGGGNGVRSAFGVQSVLYSLEARRLIEAATRGPCGAVARAFANEPPQTRFEGSLTPGTLQPMADAAPSQDAQCKSMIDAILTKWNPTSMVLGLGQALYSADASVNGLKSASSGGWLTLTWGHDFDPPASMQVLDASERMGIGATLHLRRMRNERITDPSDPNVKLNENYTLAGLNVRAGSGRLGGLLELSSRRSQAAPLADENRKRRFAGLEYKIMDGLYLVAGVGSERGRRDGVEQHVTLVNLNWGVSKQSLLVP